MAPAAPPVVSALLAALVLAAPGAAGEPLPETAEIDPAPSWSWRLAEKMTLAGDELGLHLRAISFDTLDLEFDGHRRIAHLRLQAGRAGKLAIGVDGDVAFKKGYARVDATLQVALLGRVFEIELPEFDMVPRSHGGQRYVELRLPVIDLRF